MPSALSTSAILFFGRHENHMRYVFDSFSTHTSKQVPSFPPNTGEAGFLTQPDAVVAAGGFGSASALVACTATIASTRTHANLLETNKANGIVMGNIRKIGDELDWHMVKPLSMVYFANSSTGDLGTDRNLQRPVLTPPKVADSRPSFR